MEYQFRDIEKRWQEYWKKNNIYKVEPDKSKPKYYVLDMFPYPSGAGLHVGHPLGYIASDIFARYKRMKGFNVLHPMGYDAFGLPAEQYAIQTGQHPAVTTENNIKRYREQLDNIGFSFDWSREVKTSDPKYYRWTQWIFLKLFNSWYNPETDKAEPIETLIKKFQISNFKFRIEGKEKSWNDLTEKERQEILMNYRLAYQKYSDVWWCPELGTVLANDEVQEGMSVRGGHPVFRKSLKQWFLRITAYAQRLLEELDNLDWPVSMKDIQTNWIGRSEGAMIEFMIYDLGFTISIFTTRPDTIFGAAFMVLAPEHGLVEKITTPAQQAEVEKYIQYVKTRSERDRQAEVKKVTGVFTGAYAVHPFTNEKMQIWISEYVLAGYGTGAIMAVPAHDARDFAFAKHFNLPIKQVIVPVETQNVASRENAKMQAETQNIASLQEVYEGKEGTCIHSDFINGLPVKEAIEAVIKRVEEKGIGKRKVNFKMRDAAFSRQRYWGEPFPIYYKDGIPYPMKENELPLELPPIDSYKPTPDGEAPLARAKNWKYDPTPDPSPKGRGKILSFGEDSGEAGFPLETDTMPGYAGSSWYFFRYMDAHNEKEFCSKEAQQYWQNVDLYVGGAEHATGHLLYARFWTQVLYDLGYVNVKEPFKKLVNQGMILGQSAFVLVIDLWKPEPSNSNYKSPMIFVSKNRLEKALKDNNAGFIKEALIKYNPQIDLSEIKISFGNNFKIVPHRISIDLVGENDELDIEAMNKWVFSWQSFDKEFVKEENGAFICVREPEKMSKSKFNAVNPDEVIEKYGTDTFRMYEMFLGPIDQHKPWDTKGIEGVHRFLKKLWRLFYDEKGNFLVTEAEPGREELKCLHKTIKKTEEDIERFSFNTSVSQLMICVNELTDLKCSKRAILQDLVKVLASFAPHIAEELWEQLGNKESVTKGDFPKWNAEYIKESIFNYPVAINGKTRGNVEFALTLTKEILEKEVLETELVKKYLEGKQPKKVIVVPGRMINVVV